MVSKVPAGPACMSQGHRRYESRFVVLSFAFSACASRPSRPGALAHLVRCPGLPPSRPLLRKALAAAKTSITFPTAVTDPSDAIVQLLAKVASDVQGQVASANRLELLLEEKGSLYDASIALRFLGLDPCNHDGRGGNPLRVLALASEIAMVGWSSGEVTKAICAEAVPGDPSIERFNLKPSADLGMAPVDDNSIAYGTLACGHTN